MSSVSKPRVRQNRHKQGLNQTLEKISADFREYYKLKDLPFVNEMETEYNRLSPKYIFFAVLEHEGKSDEDILRIMGISESTLRSTRSRINSKRL